MARIQIPVIAGGDGCSSTGSCGGGACGSSRSCTPQGSENDPDVLLHQAGWVLRTTIGEPRLSEIADTYRGMGYEVHVEYFSAPDSTAGVGDQEPMCTSCFDQEPGSAVSQIWGAVYVRPETRSANPGR